MSDAELVQNSVEWRMARVGSLGASDVPDVVRKTKTGVSATRANMMAFKTIERLTGRPGATYQSRAMFNGHVRQPLAVSAYELMTGRRVEPIGLVRHPYVAGAHASPDGLVGTDTVLEVKCPEPAAHLEMWLTEKVDRDYQIQAQWQLACTGRLFADFVSWNPEFPPALQLFGPKTFARDDKWIFELEEEVEFFLAELERKVQWLRNRYELAEAA